MDLARAPCRAPLTARKKGSGYENDIESAKPISYPEPSLSDSSLSEPSLNHSTMALGTRLVPSRLTCH